MSASHQHARWSPDAGASQHVLFAVEGMHCAGCARAIERAVAALPGIATVTVNPATGRAAVEWQGRGSTGLAQILAAVEGAGFKAVPLTGTAASAQATRERRAALKRVGLASLGMMQAMMYLGALYGASDISASMAQLMRVTGMVIVTPVLFYSGAPFLVGAWRDLTRRRLGMDVPVAMALLLAWVPSVFNTFRGSGEVYFDSIAMFVFFLSASRCVEMSVRHRGLLTTEALSRSLPAEVTRIEADGKRHKVPAQALIAGDRFAVPKGGVVAVDAELAGEGAPAEGAWLDESLLTGESVAVTRRVGERIRGGSMNVGAALVLVARGSVAQSTLASMVALLERAQATRPRLAQAADRAASGFVVAILVLAGITGAAWLHFDPARAFPAMLAVLVVTCPCALSLATPAALAAASTALARCGLLVTRVDAIERLARVDTVVLDKTGTLTTAEMAVVEVDLFSTLSREEALAIAASLERDSAHPLAAAFRPWLPLAPPATEVREFAGAGVEGVAGKTRWRLGRRDFAQVPGASGNVRTLATRAEDSATMYLGGPAGLAAAFHIGAPLRADALASVEALRRLGMNVVIASGDTPTAVADAARQLGVREARARLTPQEKIMLVGRLRASGHRVFMVGDGINDGPVLATADVSCAMGQGSAIAHSASDLLLVRESLAALPDAIRIARHALGVVRQNLGWALAYNLAAVPFAALGWIPPWLAALGMSLSSLGVVLNARRLANTPVSR